VNPEIAGNDLVQNVVEPTNPTQVRYRKFFKKPHTRVMNPGGDLVQQGWFLCVRVLPMYQNGYTFPLQDINFITNL
jgi:hypothetical protein